MTGDKKLFAAFSRGYYRSMKMKHLKINKTVWQHKILKTILLDIMKTKRGHVFELSNSFGLLQFIRYMWLGKKEGAENLIFQKQKG